MRKAWEFITNRVILGMLFFLVLMAAWQFRIQPDYFPQSIVADPQR
jgi:hypothetical protein